MKKISLLLSFLISFSVLFAQDAFEGTLLMKMEYEDLSEEMKPMLSLFPSASTVEVKDGISKSVTKDGMGGEMIIFSNGTTGEILTLQNSMGNKVAVLSTKEDLEKQQEGVKIEHSEETKEILGYTCKQATITANGVETVVFYTTELPNFSANLKNGIDGFPLQTIMTTDVFTVISTVTEIKKEKVKKIVMEIPSDYKVLTVEEAKQMQGGM